MQHVVKLSNVGTRIKLARTVQGLSQVELALKSKISQSSISRIERGGVEDKDAVSVLCRILNIDEEFEDICPVCASKI